MSKKQRFLVVDTETGRLDCEDHRILSIAGVSCSPNEEVRPVFNLYIKENDRLNFVVAQTESLEKKSNQNQPYTSYYLPLTKDSIAGYVAVTRELLNISDVYQIPSTVEYQINRQFDMRTGYRSKSMLVVPMRDHKNEIIGVLQ